MDKFGTKVQLFMFKFPFKDTKLLNDLGYIGKKLRKSYTHSIKDS
jgi:hypothetical protein